MGVAKTVKTLLKSFNQLKTIWPLSAMNTLNTESATKRQAEETINSETSLKKLKSDLQVTNLFWFLLSMLTICICNFFNFILRKLKEISHFNLVAGKQYQNKRGVLLSKISCRTYRACLIMLINFSVTNFMH